MSLITVLVVDDAPDIRAIVRRLLPVADYNVIEATSGPEAIEFARHWRPELILLDLCLPGLDGWGVISAIRSDPALDETPIILMTGYGVSLTMRHNLHVEVQRILCKPFELSYLEGTIFTFAHPSTKLSPLNDVLEADMPHRSGVQRAAGHMKYSAPSRTERSWPMI